MNRDTLIPIAGLVGLALAGGLLLFLSSGSTDESAATVAKSGKPGKPVKPQNAATVKSLLSVKPVGDRVPAPEGAHNLVVITGCAIRRDFVGIYGDDSDLTPTLDALADGGVRFDDALATAVSTKPALASMFTGRHALDLGLASPEVVASTAVLPASATTLAEVLSERGWYTVAVNAHPVAQRGLSHLWQGFDAMRDSHAQGWLPATRLLDHKAAQIGLDLVQKGPRDRPFYLQLVLTESHKPIRVPPDAFKPIERAGHSHAPYRATVQRFDQSLSQVLAWLRQNDALDNTLVVVLSDHGEGLSFPAHHGAAHGRHLAPSTVRVPMVFSGPGVAEGHIVQGLASTLDLMPTVLALLDVDAELSVDGRDWSAQVSGQSDRTDRTEVYSDTWYRNANRAAVWTSEIMCQRDFGSIELEDDFVDGCFERLSDLDHETAVPSPKVAQKLVDWRASHPNTSEK